VALTAYLAATRRLLHDSSEKYYTDAELTTYINSARQRIALDTGCVRGIVNFYLSASQESYPYQGAVAALTITDAGSGFTATPTVTISGGGGTGATAAASITSQTVASITITANGTGFTAAPTVTVSGNGGTASATATIMKALDILSITANYQNAWNQLAYTYFTEFQAKARYYRSITGMPALWSQGPPSGTGGGKSFYIFQIPSQSYQCDIDAIMTPTDLADDSTAEQLEYPETDLIPYYAAYLAKFQQQMFEESANFLRVYDELLRRGQAGKYQRRIPNPYGSR
jgi:hypothetical protein